MTSADHMIVFTVEETDISELEKRYWVLKAQSKTGRFDQETFKSFVCPPMPETLCEGKQTDLWVESSLWTEV